MTAAESFGQGVNADSEDKRQLLVGGTVPVLKGFK